VNPRYPFVALRVHHRCEYCHAPEVIFNFPFEVEHIRSKSGGGTDDDFNLALACRSCNIHKSDRHMAKDPTTGNLVLLFHPRIDEWSQHFSVEAHGYVVGLTSAGRATVEHLRINSPGQLAARYQWKRLGLID
jgi:hypothetical protein